jgi:hypothetical protein
VERKLVQRLDSAGLIRDEHLVSTHGRPWHVTRNLRAPFSKAVSCSHRCSSPIHQRSGERQRLSWTSSAAATTV